MARSLRNAAGDGLIGAGDCVRGRGAGIGGVVWSAVGVFVRAGGCASASGRVPERSMLWTGLVGVCAAFAGCALAEACVALTRPGGDWPVAKAGKFCTVAVVGMGALGERAVVVMF